MVWDLLKHSGKFLLESIRGYERIEFRYGQLSGIAEIIAGILGVFFVQLANCLLPFALSFAAGAMLFVVFNEVIPEISP